MRTIIAALCLVLCVSCGTKKEEKTLATSTPAASANCRDGTLPTPTPLATVPATKPTIEVPGGLAPCKLVIEDIHAGTGAAATADSTVTVQYLGVAWSNHKQFDASWDRGGPSTFPLAGVVKGWQQGIPGMKEGGRRELIIPPALGYKAAGSPPVIGPNETLVFVIDLIKVGASPTP